MAKPGKKQSGESPKFIRNPKVYLKDLCFDAQQAAEKAIKAVLIHFDVRFPYVHDLAQLLALVEQASQRVPDSIRRAASLSDYAVEARYPGLSEPVTRQEYEEAVAIAEEVVRWARGVIEQGTRGAEEQDQNDPCNADSKAG